jgi:hypothetical protein
MQLLQQSKIVPSIDFLPESYREDYARRRARYWQIVVVAAFLLTLPVASLFQYRVKRSVQLEIDELIQTNGKSGATAADLAAVQAELNGSEAMARLVTYLGHPWPHTQILAALVNDLPESVSLTELDIARGNLDGEKPAEPSEEINPQASETKDANQPPADRDFNALRTANSDRLLVHVKGNSFNLGQLHLYLGKLAKHEMFDQVDLESIATESDGSTKSDVAHFQAVLVVRRDYGDPDGPVGEQTPTPAPQRVEDDR